MKVSRNASERLAESIVSVLSTAAVRVQSGRDSSEICYEVRSRSLELRSIVLDRRALMRLLTAADGLVKIEYMKRDLLRAAVNEVEYCYPRSARTTLSLRSLTRTRRP